MKDDRSGLAEYELPEWLQREQDEARERQSIDRAKIGVAALLMLLCGLSLAHTLGFLAEGVR